MYLKHSVFYLRAVSSDVLHRRSTDLARDIGQIFQTIQIPRNGVIDKIFPDLTAITANLHGFISFFKRFDAFQIRINDKTVIIIRGEKDVTAAT